LVCPREVVRCSPASSPAAFFHFIGPAPTVISTLSLHDALPISSRPEGPPGPRRQSGRPGAGLSGLRPRRGHSPGHPRLHRLRLRSEEHTSELQSRVDLVCRLLLEKKK